MEDNVKFIFKTLIKVPIIILITYFIFNLFAFAYSYFRVMGLSYVVMQTVVENNYLPANESETLSDYCRTIESAMLTDITIGCDTDETDGVSLNIYDAESGNHKVQYGKAVTVTVSANYNWIFPLVKTNKDGMPDATGLEYNDGTDNNIKIQYKVPGLRYYADLN